MKYRYRYVSVDGIGIENNNSVLCSRVIFETEEPEEHNFESPEGDDIFEDLINVVSFYYIWLLKILHQIYHDYITHRAGQ